MKPSVSVVVCTYNRLPYLKRALRAIDAQTRADFEILLSDDGSTDGTAQWIARARPPRLRYLRSAANRGPAAAKNAALAKARGEFVAFLDSDDLWRPRHLESALRCFARPRVVFAFAKTRCIDGRGRGVAGRAVASTPADVFRRVTGVRATPATSATVVRRDALRALGGFDERFRRYGDDGDLFLRFGVRYGPDAIASTGKVTVGYRVHPNQLGRVYEGILRGEVPPGGWSAGDKELMFDLVSFMRKWKLSGSLSAARAPAPARSARLPAARRSGC